MNGEQKKKNNSFLIQGAILAAAGIVTRLIGLAYRIPVNNILGDVMPTYNWAFYRELGASFTVGIKVLF